MPHIPDHLTHDPELVAAYAAGDATGPDLAAATELVAACTECAELHRDLRAIATALPELPAPRRTRDFRLTPEQAASLQPSGWRGVLAAFASPRFRLAAPLGTGLAAAGLAGLLLATPGGLIPRVVGHLGRPGRGRAGGQGRRPAQRLGCRRSTHRPRRRPPRPWSPEAMASAAASEAAAAAPRRGTEPAATRDPGGRSRRGRAARSRRVAAAAGGAAAGLERRSRAGRRRHRHRAASATGSPPVPCSPPPRRPVRRRG